GSVSSRLYGSFALAYFHPLPFHPLRRDVRGEKIIVEGKRRRVQGEIFPPHDFAALGASMAVMRLPSIDGAFSTLETSASFSRIESMMRRPSSMCCNSRPRNSTLTSTLSLCSRNLRAWLILVSTSCSPVLGRTRSSFTFCWRTLLDFFPFCEFAKRIFP